MNHELKNEREDAVMTSQVEQTSEQEHTPKQGRTALFSAQDKRRLHVLHELCDSLCNEMQKKLAEIIEKKETVEAKTTLLKDKGIIQIVNQEFHDELFNKLDEYIRFLTARLKETEVAAGIIENFIETPIGSVLEEPAVMQLLSVFIHEITLKKLKKQLPIDFSHFFHILDRQLKRLELIEAGVAR